MRGGRVRAGRVGRSAMERCSFFNVGVIRRCYRLFAAFNIADGTVISQVQPAPRHRVPRVPDRYRQGRARRPGRAPGVRQLRHPQHR